MPLEPRDWARRVSQCWKSGQRHHPHWERELLALCAWAQLSVPPRPKSAREQRTSIRYQSRNPEAKTGTKIRRGRTSVHAPPPPATWKFLAG